MIRTNLISTLSLAHWILNLLVITLLNTGTYTGSLILIDLSVGSYSIRNLTVVSVEHVKRKKQLAIYELRMYHVNQLTRSRK